MVGRVMPVRVGTVELLVETVPVAGSEQTSGRRLDEAGRRVVDAFDRAEEAIVEIAGKLAGTVAELGRRSTRPEQVQVQFGLKFTAQGNVIVAGASAEASLQVTISYAGPSAAGPPAAPAVDEPAVRAGAGTG